MKKISILFITLLLLFASCGAQKEAPAETTNQVEETTAVIKKTSTLFKEVQNVGEKYQHFFSTSSDGKATGLIGLGENGEFTELGATNAYLYQSEEQKIYEVTIKDVETALGYTVRPLAVQGDILVVFQEVNNIAEMTSEMKIVNQEKVLVITGTTNLSVEYNNTDIYVSIGFSQTEDGATGSGINAVKIDEMGEVNILGQVGYLAPRGYPLKPLFGFLAVGNKQYYIGQTEIYEIRNNKIEKTDIIIQEDSPVISKVISDGESIYAVRKKGENGRVICIWDAEWNVKEKLDAGTYSIDNYSDGGLRHSLYLKDDKLYSAGGIYAWNSIEVLNVSSFSYDVKKKQIINTLEIETEANRIIIV